MRRSGTAVVLIMGLLLVPACGTDTAGHDSIDDPWRAEVDTIGDTVVVHTVAGSANGHGRLLEELRIGRLEGEEHEIFGRVAALAVTATGDVLVYDAQATLLRRYAPDGRYLGTIGGAGSGPGEYRNVAGMTVLADGRIVVNDFGNRRFNVYGRDGETAATWLVRPAVAELRPLYALTDGGVFLHDLRRANGGPSSEEILVRLDGEGVAGDTVPIPYAGHRPAALELRTETLSAGQLVPFVATSHWSVVATGEVVAMIGDRYAIDVHRTDGSVLRIGRRVEPVPVSDEEKAAEEERVTEFFRGLDAAWRWDGPAIPATKPPVTGLHTGSDSTIWVRVAQPGEALPEQERLAGARSFVREPVTFDVFELDGRFLGRVRAPDGVRLQPAPVIGGDRVWAVVEDENGVDFVARLRVAWE